MEFKKGDLVEVDFVICEIQRIPTSISPYYEVFPVDEGWKETWLTLHKCSRLEEEIFDITFKEKRLYRFIKQYN